MLKKDVNKYSKTINFLDYFTKKCENTKKRYDNIININIELTNLLNKKIDSEKVTRDDYEKIVKYGCPNYTFKVYEPEKYDDHQLDSCDNTDCVECWKSYINALLEELDEGDHIKRI